jgi:hypothetical protein
LDSPQEITAVSNYPVDVCARSGRIAGDGLLAERSDPIDQQVGIGGHDNARFPK